MAVCQQVYPGLPTTERGRGILIHGDIRSGTIAYTHGRLVVLRNLADPQECDLFREHSHQATVARFSPTGEWVASGDSSGMVKIWSKHGEHKVKFELKALSGSIDDLQWSPDGQRIVVCGDGKGTTTARAFMWDSGNNIGEFDGHSKRVLSCAFRPTRPFKIVTCGEDMLINFYEGPPFRFKSSHRLHKNFVNCIRFSPDGSKFISVGSDYKMLVFNGSTGEKIGELSSQNGHTGSVYAASWSPDGKQVLTVSADKTAKIWDISASGEGKVNTTFSFAEHPGIEHMQVGCLWLGKYIITVSLSGLINYLDPTNVRVPSRILSGHSKFVTALTVVKNEGASEIYSSSYDGMLVRWRIGEGCFGRVEGDGHRNSIIGLICGDGDLVSCALDDTIRRTPLPAEQYDYGEIALGGQATGFDVAALRPELIIASTVNGVSIIKGSKVVLKLPLSFSATAAAIAPDGTEAAIGGADGKIHIYEVRGDGSDLIEQAVLERHRGLVTLIRYSSNGKMFASGDQNREVVVWDRITREVKVKNMVYHNARVTSLAWSPDNIRLATGSIDMSIIVWDTTKTAMSRLQIKGAHQGAVTALGFKDATTLVSGGDDTCIRLWKLPAPVEK